MEETETCYMCNNFATSREHVPPLCVFPKQADAEGIDYQVNLITVPSCDKHNSKKSDDDQYLDLVLTMLIEGNQVAQRQFSTKGLRTIQRRPHLLTQIGMKSQPVIVDGQVTGIFQIDKHRIDRITGHLARGIYFRHFGEKLSKPLYPFYFFGLQNFNQSYFLEFQTLKNQFLNHLKYLFETEQRHGDNPDVFYYQIHKNPEDDYLLVRLVFYENVNIVTHHSYPFMYIASRKKITNYIDYPFIFSTTKLAILSISLSDSTDTPEPPIPNDAIWLFNSLSLKLEKNFSVCHLPQVNPLD